MHSSPRTAFFAIMLAFAVSNGYISTLIMLASVVEPSLEEEEVDASSPASCLARVARYADFELNAGRCDVPRILPHPRPLGGISPQLCCPGSHLPVQPLPVTTRYRRRFLVLGIAMHALITFEQSRTYTRICLNNLTGPLDVARQVRFAGRSADLPDPVSLPLRNLDNTIAFCKTQEAVRYSSTPTRGRCHMGRHRSHETSSDTESSATSDRSSSSSGSENDRSSTDSTSSDSSRYSREVRLPILILMLVPSFTSSLCRSRTTTQRDSTRGCLSGLGCCSSSSCSRPSGLHFCFRALRGVQWTRLLRGAYQRSVSRNRSHGASNLGD